MDQLQTAHSTAVLAAVTRTAVIILELELTLQSRSLPGTASEFGKPGSSESRTGELQRPETLLEMLRPRGSLL